MPTTYTDSILHESIEVVFQAESNGSVFVEFRRKKIRRHVTTKRGGYFLNLTDDKYFVHDSINKAESAGFLHSSEAINVCRRVAAGTYKGDMFAKLG